MRSEVTTGNVKYSLNSLWTSPSSVLATGVFLKASHIVLIFVTPDVGQHSSHCIMYEVKLVPRPVTVYVSSKARPLLLFQMLAEVVAVCCAHNKFLQASDWP